MTQRLLILAVMVFALPLFAFAQEDTGADITITGSATTTFSDTPFARNGVFGCNVTGSYSMSVGSLSATGGVYVPVNDAAVTLNTGYLVYKECTLRGIVNRIRENSTATLQKAIIKAYERGRAGLPLFSTNIPSEQTDIIDKTYVDAIQGGALNTLNPVIKAAASRAILQGYMKARNTPNSALSCSYSGNLSTVFNGSPDRGVFAGLQALLNPSCDPLFATLKAGEQISGAAAYAVNNAMTQLQWGNGTYPRTTIDPATGLEVVTTPGAIVGANVLQALQTGFTQLQNANDIDQIVTALFSGITTQVVADQGGLAGLTQKNGGQQSYLDRVVSATAEGLRNSAANAALTILGAAKQVEQGFLGALNGIAQKALEAITKIRAQENTCWNLIIEKVCTAAPGADNKCTAKPESCTTDASGNQSCPAAQTLKVATTTAASQAVIGTNITPLASSTRDGITIQERTLSVIDQLIAQVSNSADVVTQGIALKQLDALVGQQALHNQNDLQGILKQRENIEAQIDTLISDTAERWGDNPDVNVGWCNVNNAAVLTYWKNKWKQ